jgi:AcrR family transcriptional regulator
MKPASNKIRSLSLAPKRVKKVKLKRAEKAEQIHRDLFHAAAKVVGEHGYHKSMILMITQKANVANGTFYNYFENRQELFDQMLPTLGREMLDFIAERSVTGATELEKEEQRFTAFFDYLHEHPEFYRILYEAEVFAQGAFDEHTNQVLKGYTRLLRRALNAGEITGYTPKELEVLALILMGTRHYIAMRYLRQEHGDGTVPGWAVGTYKKFIKGGLRAIAEDE